MVKVTMTNEGLKVDDESWSKLRLDSLPVDKLLQLARLQRTGDIKDFTSLIETLIKNEGQVILEPKTKGKEG
jgi:hypothetical protein